MNCNYYGYVYISECCGKTYIGQHCGSFDDGYFGSGFAWKQFIKDKPVKVRLLETCNTPEELNDREKYWIKQYIDNDNNMNLVVKGSCNSDAHRKDISEKTTRTMSNPRMRQRISSKLREYRKNTPFSNTHRQRIAKKALGNNNGVNNKSHSIKVQCITRGKVYTFDNKLLAAEWWYKTMPFSTTFAPITYTRKITDSINGKTLKFKGCLINQDIKWKLYKKEGDKI